MRSIGRGRRSVCLGFAALLSLGFSIMTALGADDSLVGSWLAEDIRNRGVIDNAQSRITFEIGGAVNGSGGCNRFAGTARIEGDRLAMSPLAATKRACPPALMDQEEKFFSALQEAKGFRMDGPFLRLIAEDGAELMRLIRM